MFDRLDVKVVSNAGVVAAHHDKIDRLVGIQVKLLMGDTRCEVDKIAWANFRCELEPLAPADLAPAFGYIDDDLVHTVIMGCSLCIGR
jgi:hypothetical protein